MRIERRECYAEQSICRPNQFNELAYYNGVHMTEPHRRVIAQAWTEEMDDQLSLLSAKQRRGFFVRVVQHISREWSPGLTAATLFAFSPKYARAVSKKIESLLEQEQ